MFCRSTLWFARRLQARHATGRSEGREILISRESLAPDAAFVSDNLNAFGRPIMPWQLTYVEPEVFLRHRGLNVYRTYEDDDLDQRVWAYWFTLNPSCGDDSCSCGTTPCRNVFDV